MNAKDDAVCLIGSVKQEADWRKWVKMLTMQGYRVWEAGLYGTLDQDIPKAIWDTVTDVHQTKIDDSQIIAIITKPDGSIGAHTAEDLRYALSKAKHRPKKILFVEELFRGVTEDA